MDDEHRLDEDKQPLLGMPSEAGDIGDEQLPAGESKTDKTEWNYSANRIKQRILPDKVREFLNGL